MLCSNQDISQESVNSSHCVIGRFIPRQIPGFKKKFRAVQCLSVGARFFRQRFVLQHDIPPANCLGGVQAVSHAASLGKDPSKTDPGENLNEK
jgi:hypothetical protein